MSLLNELTPRVAAGNELSTQEAADAARLLASANAGDDEKAAFLTALHDRGETVGEVTAFASTFRTLSVDPGVSAWAPRAIDVCGTGGDHSGTFNVSSATGFVLAAAGIPVFKHGNRSITSKCGSSEFLGALGVPPAPPPEVIRASLERLNFAFFFAPSYHPAFKNIAPVRRALAASGRRSVFNILGPLLNPGHPAHQLLGVFAASWVDRIAGSLEGLGLRAALVVHGRIDERRGIDELTTASQNIARGVGRLRDNPGDWNAAAVGLASSPLSDLAGADLATNLALLDDLLNGRAPQGLTDTVVLNAAAGLWITGHADSPAAGVMRARELLLGGAVAAWLQEMKAFYRQAGC